MMLGTWSCGVEGPTDKPKLTSSVWIQAVVETQLGSVTVQLRSQLHTFEAHSSAATN